MVKFRDWECEVSVESYADNGNTALQLYTEEDGPIATATVNIGVKLPKDLAYIKDYSENEGMLDALQEEGIVIGIFSYAPLGFVDVPLCKLDLKKLGVEDA